MFLCNGREELCLGLGVGSKNNDFKIFQGLNSDSCCDLSVEMVRGISSKKQNMIMQICAMRCYKRYCLSQ